MRKRFRSRSAALAMILALATARTGKALTITPTYDATITGDPNAAAIEATINSAIITYESLLLNPINVTVTFSKMSTGLGESDTFRQSDTYSDFLFKLSSSATSASDTTALAHLPTQTNNPVDGNAGMDLSTANARALGIFTGTSTVGGDISLNISATNITRGGTFNSSNYDLFAVVSHELDEILGTGSALIGGNTGNPTPPTGAVTPEDLFRYTSAGARSFDYTSNPAYFSIDGTTDIAQFNQDSTSATKADFGDWATSSTHRVQDAFGTPGVALNLGPAEKTALDVIGYTLLTSLTWNPNNSFASGAPTDGLGAWTTTSGATWYNGTSSSVWVNGTVQNAQNAQFGTPGTASTTPYTVTLGSPITAGTIVFANANYTIAGGGNSLTIANGITAAVNATVSANIILGGANTWQVASGATLAVSGNISEGSTGLGLTKQGPGVLSLSGTNSYTGGTTIAAGTLSLLSSGALPAGGNVTVSGGALDLNGQSPSIGNLTFGDGASTSAATLIDSAATKGVLTLGGDITYVGTFNNGFSYFPAATVSANLQLAAGAHAVTSADGSRANSFDLVISGALTGAGGITKNGVSTYLALTGANTYSGATIINNGFLFTGATNTLSVSSALTINSPGVLDLNPISTQSGVTTGSYDQTIGSLAGGGQITLGSATLSIGNDGTSTTYSGSIFGTGGITKIGAGALTLTGSSGYSGPTIINAGTLQIGAGGGAGAINSASAVSGSAGTLAVDLNFNLGFSNTISGSVGVTNIGSGTLFLLANNSYSGTTTIGVGESIYAGSVGTAGSVGSGPLVNNGTFNISRTDAPTFANQISGSGLLILRSTGTVTLSGNSAGFSGATHVNAGTLVVSGSISGSAVTVNSGGTLAGTGATGAVTAQAGGTVLPGSSTGSGLLSTGAFSLLSGAHLSLEIGGTANTGLATTQYSELNVTGSVALGGDLQITLFGGYTPKVNDIFYIILNDGNDGVVSTFSNAPIQGSLFTSGGVQYKVDYTANGEAGGTGNDVSIQVMAVPEPGGCALLLSGVALTAGCARRRRR